MTDKRESGFTWQFLPSELQSDGCKAAQPNMQKTRLHGEIVSVSQSNFISHCGGRTLRTWTSEDESYSVFSSEYQYGTQIPQTFLVI